MLTHTHFQDRFHVLELEMRSGAVSGGTHHAFPDAGEGFCVFNDLAACARLAQKDFGLKKAIRKALEADLRPDKPL